MASSRAVPSRRRVIVLAISVLPGVTVATKVSAQAGESDLHPPVDTSASPTNGEEQDDRLARARTIVAAADHLFVAGHYAAALAEYTRAYEILEGHPRQYWVLHNLAACNERLFRYDMAIELYQQYLNRAPSTEDDRDEVSAIIKTLRSLLATLVVESGVSGDVWLDDRRLGAAPGRWLVPTGRHTVEIRAQLYEAQRREIQLAPGEVQAVHFELQKLSAFAGPGRGYFWASAGLAGIAAITGAACGFAALNDRQQGLREAELHLDTRAEAGRTRQWATAADVGFGTAILFGATAAVLYFVTDWSDAQPSDPPGGRSSPRSSHRMALGSLGGPGTTFRVEF